MARTAGERSHLDVPISRRSFAAAASALPFLLAACSRGDGSSDRSGSVRQERHRHRHGQRKTVRATWPHAALDEIDDLLKPHAGCVSLVCTPLDAATFAPLRGGIAIDATVRRTAASLIKLAVLVTAFDAVSAGSLSLGEHMTVAQGDIVGGAGDIQAKGAGVTYTVDELLHAMIAQSDNTAANLIVGRLGMDAVNDECSRLHLDQTRLCRLMMDEAARQAGRENVTSARDVAVLLRRIAAGTVATPELCERARAYLLDQRDTAGIVQGLPAGVQVAHKTGSLDGVQHDAAIVYGDRPYVLAVLTQGMEREAALGLMRDVSAAVWRAAVS